MFRPLLLGGRDKVSRVSQGGSRLLGACPGGSAHGDRQTFVLCGHSQPRVPLRLQEAVRGGAPPCWLQQDEAGFFAMSQELGPERGFVAVSTLPPPRWDFGQLQPLVPWNQQTLSVCHSYRKGKPRGPPDQPQRLRCERERGWGLLRERLFPSLQGQTQTSPATGEAAGGQGPPRLSQGV